MPKRHIIWIAALLVATAAVVVTIQHRFPTLGMPRSNALVQATELIETNYLWTISGEALQDDAITALVETLDPYSHYLPARQGADLADHLAGRAGGVGLDLINQNGQWIIVAPRYLSPAYRAGVLPGDVIIRIGEQSVSDWSLAEIHSVLCAPNGQEVTLTLQRDGELLEPVSIQCDRYALDSVTGLYRDAQGRWVYRFAPTQPIAYIALTEITDKTEPQLREALRKIGQVDWLILDLRGNPGGPMPVAVSLADMFFADGPIVHVVERGGVKTYQANGDVAIDESTRVVVLVNGMTASAAEVLAGALQQRHRAVLVGQGTEGKRYIQHVYPLEGGRGQLSLTTGYYRFEPFRTHRDGSPAIPAQAAAEPLFPAIGVPTDAAQEETRLRYRCLQALPMGYGHEAAPDDRPATLLRDTLEHCLMQDPQLMGALWLTRIPAIHDQVLDGLELESLSIQVVPDNDVMRYLGYEPDDADSGN
jgi:carboxyl-terminal processing protease